MMESKWDFDGGLIPLDFANTADWHASSKPEEKLLSYADLVDWSQQAGIISNEEAHDLIRHAASHATEAKQVLTQAIEIREAVYRLFSAVANHQPPPPRDIDCLNRAFSKAMRHLRIKRDEGGFAYSWSADEIHLSRPLWPILQSSADLLTSDELYRVGECADDRGCGFLFHDTSRNHSRRWCSMDSCGNRAKAQRHYQRSKTQDDLANPEID